MTPVRRRQFLSALLWVAVLAGTTALMFLARARLDKAHIALAYLLVVLGASSAGGRTVGLSIAAVAFCAFNYLFLPPYYTFVITDPLDWLILVAFMVTSVVAAQLLYRASTTALTATRRAEEVDRLATLGAETLSAPDASAALGAMATVIRDALGTDNCDLFRIDTQGALALAASATARAGEPPTNAIPAPADGVAAWLAGRAESAVELPDGTTRLDPTITDDLQVRTLFRTLRVRDQVVGVLRVASREGLTLSSDRARLLDALAYYAALGVERVRLVATAERAEAERQVEALRSSLLMAVSHDLRTPLTTIKGLAHEIAGGANSVPRAAVIEEEADRLDALVGDLLELSRIQAGAVRPSSAVNTADEMIGAALQRAQGLLGQHTVAVSLSDDVLAARCDFTQTQRIIVNLLENAAKYAPAGTSIEVTASRDATQLLIAVADEGPGVPAGEEERIFEAFHRPPGTSPDIRGTGLGLSIARGLAQAQGGTLTYRARTDNGSLFTLALPIVNAPDDTTSAPHDTGS
jgi:two-component system sensor histidine kinase KdpD